jgi:uncharacterized protein (DUF427 family)
MSSAQTSDGRSVKIPGPDHPIAIEATAGRVIVTVAGETIADSRNALTLIEANYSPGGDVDMTKLAATDHSTYCPYKGDCSYFSIIAGGERSVNAVWTYESPFPAVQQIENYLAFYTERVDSIGVTSGA